MADQHGDPDPTTDTVTLSESEHRRLRGLRIFQARLSVMGRIVRLLMSGWRVTGKEEETHWEVEPNYLDRDGHERLKRFYKALVEQYSTTHELEEKHDHFAKQFGRKPFGEICCSDTDALEKCETQSTDEACNLEYPDGPDSQAMKTRSYVITMRRYETVIWLREMALLDIGYENTPGSISFDQLLTKDQREAIEDRFGDVDGWFDGMLRLNTERVSKYDEYAASKGQPSYEMILSTSLKLIEHADAVLVRECESWKVDEK